MLLLLAVSLFQTLSYAQAPNGINYQAVIRNNTGTLMANTPTAIRVSIRQTTATGTIVYSERQNVTTDQFGLVNFVIGSGTLLSGNFTNIPWANGPFFLDLGVAFSGLPNPAIYMPYGTQQMMSVPYALYAKSSGNLVNQWKYGAGVPASNLGLVGDYYLDTATGNVYNKTNSTTWVLITNITGPQGVAGPVGITGPTGLTGPTGAAGAAGAAGPVGLTGPAGVAGAIGAQGIQGLPGTNGAVGATGPAGPTGPSGASGTNGTNGAVGATGPVGLTGPAGAQGIQGATGLLTGGSAAGNTPYWNGSQWVVNNSNVFNNGAEVGIGTVSPNTSAKLDVESTTQGFLPPRMTTTQRNAITSPAAGLTIYNTTVNCLQWWNGSIWFDGCGNNTPSAALTTLNCGGATTTGTLTNGSAANGVSTAIPYTGGNAGTYGAQSVSSTGVVGLTATLAAGTLANGAGSLTYTITGTPTTSGTASFAITVGGQSCSFTVSVGTAIGQYPAGTVNCAGATTVLDVTNPTTGRIWMDRNLGATQVATSSTDVNSYGDLYQWGRRADGHQCRTSPTTATLSSVDQPAHGSFIVAPNAPYDWRSPQNANLWQGVNGVNNPCPSGYRIPTETEINAERLSWSQDNSVGAFASPLKWTLAGYRRYDNGGLYVAGANGGYWSSTVSGTDSRDLNFSSGGASMYDTNRADGFTVRCLKH